MPKFHGVSAAGREGVELSTVMVRKHARVLPWLRALAFAAVVAAALTAVPFYPVAVRPVAALAAGALGLFAPAVGVLVIVVALALPLAAGNFITGVLFLVVGLASVQYLGERGGRGFLVVSLAFVAAALHADWALAPLAGYVVGTSEGGVMALLACATLELAGIVFGHPATGVLATGGTKPLVDLAHVAALKDPLAFRWIAPAVAHADVNVIVKTFGSVRSVALLLVQPLLWGVAAALAGTFRERGARALTVGVVSATTAALAAVTMAVSAALGGPVSVSAMLPVAAVSIVVAGAFTALAEWAFPLQRVPVGTLPSLRTEDAEVDELLRMIADAEERLEDRHATDATVLITDMKAFSRITQEQGTVATAKIIQRHRDLLLPLVTRCGGHGKSTGGDGLVASFPAAEDALAAAVKMQQALKTYNERKSEDKQVLVRIGIASGDVILDRSGCPFIGDALNLAARVMALADGGQVFAAADVVESAIELPSPVVSHGEFSLKNIARPVNVFEMLWDADQQPKRPELDQTGGPAAQTA